MSFLLILIDLALLNIGFFVSFWLRFGFPFPPDDFLVFKSVSMFLTLIFMSNLFLFKAYRNRFMSSWDLFAKIFLGLFCGTLLSMAFFYTFRFKWGTFPTSLFPI
jgi:FlaA1/EpsC-like NDP-sugar epimerase